MDRQVISERSLSITGTTCGIDYRQIAVSTVLVYFIETNPLPGER